MALILVLERPDNVARAGKIDDKKDLIMKNEV